MRQPEHMNPDKRSEAKLYILRNVSWEHILDPGKGVFFMSSSYMTKFQATLFDFGYYWGNKHVWVRNNEDLKEVHKLLTSNNSHSVT